jgi:hypothetical protein
MERHPWSAKAGNSAPVTSPLWNFQPKFKFSTTLVWAIMLIVTSMAATTMSKHFFIFQADLVISAAKLQIYY